MAGGVPCKCIDGKPGARGLTWKGAYSGGTVYTLRDAVSYLGSSYFYKATEDASGVLPTDTASWDVLAVKGADGGGGGGGGSGPDATNSTIVLSSPVGTAQAVTVQLKDSNGDNLTAKTSVRWWTSESPFGSADGAAQSMNTTTGSTVTGINGVQLMEGVTNDSGLLVVSVVLMGAGADYFNICSGSMVKASSDTLAFTAGGGD